MNNPALLFRLSHFSTCIALFAVWASTGLTLAAEYPTPTETDYVIKNFRFHSGGSLPELRMHYRTLGQPKRDENGNVRNAVLILHGTTGSGKQFLIDEFAGELFGKGGLLVPSSVNCSGIHSIGGSCGIRFR
jgi:homoserine O-acetyltransferase